MVFMRNLKHRNRHSSLEWFGLAILVGSLWHHTVRFADLKSALVVLILGHGSHTWFTRRGRLVELLGVLHWALVHDLLDGMIDAFNAETLINFRHQYLWWRRWFRSLKTFIECYSAFFDSLTRSYALCLRWGPLLFFVKRIGDVCTATKHTIPIIDWGAFTANHHFLWTLPFSCRKWPKSINTLI